MSKSKRVSVAQERRLRGFGPNRDGLLDPERRTVHERATYAPERLDAEQARRDSPSPMIRALQRAVDKGPAGTWRSKTTKRSGEGKRR